MNQALVDREKGQFPVSIATSLAIESAFGIYPEKEVPVPPIKDVTAIWFSVRTLWRNMVGSVEATQQAALSYEDVAEQLANELVIIESVINEFTSGRCKVVFYHCSYISAARLFRHSKHWVPNTDKQKAAWMLEQQSLQQLTLLSPGVDLRHFDFDFDSSLDDNVFLVSHYPVDLFNRYKFRSLQLLESHTGAIKPPGLWYTKLRTLDRNFVNMPFDRMTLQVFGDGVMFVALPAKIRDHLQQVGIKHKWTPVTTKDYVVTCIGKEHDPIFEGFTLKLYN